jgi:hypothetical protein
MVEPRRHLPASLLSCLLATAAAAFSTGPPDGRTGAPGEATCNAVACHSSFDLNEGAVTLELLDARDGGPLTGYAPSRLLDLAVRIGSTEAGRRRWGFEMTARDASGSTAGSFDVGASVGVQVSPPGQGTYVKQGLNGAGDLQPAGQSWRFLWQAPPPGAGDVTFWACGNAADRSFSPSGDFIECSSFLVPLQASDADGDGVPDAVDNCPDVANLPQADADADGFGDACDRCPLVPDPQQLDLDGDGFGAECDCDDSRSGVHAGAVEVCGNALDDDCDGDADFDDADCAGDFDGDGVANASDNCRAFANPAQEDLDGNGRGDACDFDWGDVAPPEAPDGAINVQDAVRALRVTVGLEALVDGELERGNVAPATSDGGSPPSLTPTLEEPLRIDVADVVLILRAAVGLHVFAEPA